MPVAATISPTVSLGAAVTATAGGRGEGGGSGEREVGGASERGGGEMGWQEERGRRASRLSGWTEAEMSEGQVGTTTD